MPKPNVRQNKGTVDSYREFTFTDPRTGTEYPFRLKALSMLEMESAGDFGAELTRRYVIGNYIDASGERHNVPETIALIDLEDGTQKPLEASSAMMTKFAVLERAQGIKRNLFDDSPKDGVYNAIELAIIVETALPVWLELEEAWRQVKAEALEKKFRPAQGGTPSASPSEPATVTPE